MDGSYGWSRGWQEAVGTGSCGIRSLIARRKYPVFSHWRLKIPEIDSGTGSGGIRSLIARRKYPIFSYWRLKIPEIDLGTGSGGIGSLIAR